MIILLVLAGAVISEEGWYTEGDFAPKIRMEITLVNTLDIDRKDCPVVIRRSEMPIQALHEMSVTVVDLQMPPNLEPSPEMLAEQGGHLILAETNGHQIFRQLDDIDKDGLWDELFL